MNSSRVPRVDRGAAGGLILTAVAALLYAAIHERAQEPLTIFVVGPLVAAVMTTPVIAAGVSAVAISVAAGLGVAFGLSDSALLARLGIIITGSALGVAAARARTQRERRLTETGIRLAVADTFQSGLVPVARPADGTTVATRYRPGARGMLLGGDFLDVITLPDGATGFIIGDVSGHDARAAAFGTAVRAGWKGIAYSRPSDLASWLDDVEVAFFHDRRYPGFVTAVTGRVDGRDGSISMVSAGHPWPIAVSRTPSIVEVVTSPPLGVAVAGTQRCITRGVVSSGEPWLFYTDGLVENAWSPGGRAEEAGLLAALRSLDDPTDLDALIARLGPNGFQDDVALLLVGR